MGYAVNVIGRLPLNLTVAVADVARSFPFSPAAMTVHLAQIIAVVWAVNYASLSASTAAEVMHDPAPVAVDLQYVSVRCVLQKRGVFHLRLAGSK